MHKALKETRTTSYQVENISKETGIIKRDQVEFWSSKITNGKFSRGVISRFEKAERKTSKPEDTWRLSSLRSIKIKKD